MPYISKYYPTKRNVCCSHLDARQDTAGWLACKAGIAGNMAIPDGQMNGLSTRHDTFAPTKVSIMGTKSLDILV